MAEIPFFSFYFFKTSGIFATSFKINVSQYILSQSYNAAVFYFGNISFLEHVLK